jgi:hypothetical protein
MYQKMKQSRPSGPPSKPLYRKSRAFLIALFIFALFATVTHKIPLATKHGSPTTCVSSDVLTYKISKGQLNEYTNFEDPNPPLYRLCPAYLDGVDAKLYLW